MRTKVGRVLLAIGLIASVIGFRSEPRPAAAGPAAAAVNIEPGGYVNDVVLNLAGDRAYASVDGGANHGVVVYDTADWTVVTVIDVGGIPRGLDLTHDDSTLLVAVRGAGEVVEIDTATNTIERRVDLLAQLGDWRTYDVAEVRSGDVFVTADPGGNGLAYLVRYSRSDPAGTAARVAGSTHFRSSPRLHHEYGADVLGVAVTGTASLTVVDVTDPAAPILLRNDSAHSTSWASPDYSRDRVFSFGGEVISTLEDVITEGGYVGYPAVDTVGGTLWTSESEQYHEHDLTTLELRGTYPADCDGLKDPDHWARVSVELTADRSSLIVIWTGSPTPTGSFCLEPLDRSAATPSAPDEVTAVARDRAAVVSWRWDDFGVEPIDEFVVTSSPGGRTCVVQAFSCVVGGLTNGTSYTFTVAARVDGVDGFGSAASNPVVPAPSPAAPRALVVGDDGAASWSFGSGGGVDDLTVRYRETQAPADWLDPLIIGGDPLTIDDHRYGVKLFSFWGAALAGECGGVLIDPEWVLTAAHCTETQPTGTWYTQVQYFTVIPGLADWTDFEGDLDRHRVFSEQIIVHPRYNRETLENDLALVRLETPVGSDVADTIPLYPFASLTDGAQAFVSGWGADERGVLPDVVRGVEVSVDADCGSWPAVLQGFDPTETLCTTAIGEGVCAGDSGGPVVVNESGSLFLAGVVSFGSSAGCGVDPNLPDGHVRVATYIEWIEAIVGPLWSELSLPTSATTAQLDDLRPGRTYVVTVEAGNEIGSAFAVRTVTTAGMRVLGPDSLTADCLTPIGHPFVDVPSSSFASDSIGCIYALGITTGTSATAYSPKNFVTRGQMAAFVARFIGSVTGRSCVGSHPFVDVPVDSWMNGPVGCISDLGITNGTSPTTYAPNDFVTREQMAAFVARVYRAVTGEECSIPTDFGDVPSTSFAYRDIGCIASIGVTQGTSPTTYSPKDFVTREQMAAFVERLFKTVTA